MVDLDRSCHDHSQFFWVNIALIKKETAPSHLSDNLKIDSNRKHLSNTFLKFLVSIWGAIGPISMFQSRSPKPVRITKGARSLLLCCRNYIPESQILTKCLLCDRSRNILITASVRVATHPLAFSVRAHRGANVNQQGKIMEAFTAYTTDK